MSDSKPTDGVTAPETDATVTAPETASEHLATQSSAAESSAPDHAVSGVAAENVAADNAPAATSSVNEATESALSSANETKAYDRSALVAAAFETEAAPSAGRSADHAATAPEPLDTPAPLVEPAAEASAVAHAAPVAPTAPAHAAETEVPAPVAAESVKRDTYIPAAALGTAAAGAVVGAGAATLAATDAPATDAPAAYVPGATTAAAPSAASYSAAPAATSTPIYVQAPAPPSPAGNRGGGILIALIATVAYAVIFAVTAFVIAGITSVSLEQAVSTFTEFVVRPVFYIPVIFFFIAFSLLIAIVNRGGWWAYVLFSFLVAVIVYFSYIGGALLTVKAWEFTPSEAAAFISTQWLNPGAIAAAVIAREVPIWFGAWIAARGRKVTARNTAASEEYDRLLDEGPQLAGPY